MEVNSDHDLLIRMSEILARLESRLIVVEKRVAKIEEQATKYTGFFLGVIGVGGLIGFIVTNIEKLKQWAGL